MNSQPSRIALLAEAARLQERLTAHIIALIEAHDGSRAAVEAAISDIDDQLGTLLDILETLDD